MSLPTNFRSKYGPYALVTGASSGIGAEYARQLAATGLNLVITARRAALLQELSKDLKQKYDSIDIRIVVADLSSEEDIEKIVSETKELEIGLLVSNAGLEVFGSFFAHDVERHKKVTKVNAMATLQLVYHFGKRMIDRRKGGIIIVSSLGSYAFPFFSTYSATKAYISNLGMILNYELKPFGVDVLVSEPGLVDTAMMDKLGELLDAREIGYAAATVEETVGLTLPQLGKAVVYTPGLIERITMWFLKVCPRWLVFSVLGRKWERMSESDKILRR